MADHLRVDSLVRWCVAIVFVMVAIPVRGTVGGPTDSARQQECQVGQNVTLRCHTDLDSDVDWMYKRNQTESESYVFTNGVVYVTFGPRFTVDRPVEGDYNLVITDVRLSDAGVYVCVEDGGFGTKHEVELIVNGDQSELATTVVMTLNPESTNSTATIIVVVVVVIIVAVAVAIFIIVLLLRNRTRRPKSQPEDTVATGPEKEPLTGASGRSQEHKSVQQEHRSADSDESGKNVHQESSKRAMVANVVSDDAAQAVEAKTKDKPLPPKKPIPQPESKSAAGPEKEPQAGASGRSQEHKSVQQEHRSADSDESGKNVHQESSKRAMVANVVSDDATKAVEAKTKDKPLPPKKPMPQPESKSAAGGCGLKDKDEIAEIGGNKVDITSMENCGKL